MVVNRSYASASPLNDMSLIISLREYESVDEVCAQEALKAFLSYLWYLTEEMVPLALYNHDNDAME